MLVERLLESLSPESEELTDDDFFAEFRLQGVCKSAPMVEPATSCRLNMLVSERAREDSNPRPAD